MIDVFNNKTTIDDFKKLINGTLNEIDADVKLNILTIFSEVVDVYLIKSVRMVEDMIKYYTNDKYAVDINTSEYNDVCKNADLNGYVVATFNVAIKPKYIKVEYQYFSTKEKMCKSLYNTSCDKHSYRREIIYKINKDFFILNCNQIKPLIKSKSTIHTFDAGKSNVRLLAQLIDMLLNPTEKFDILITTVQSNLDDNSIADNTDPDEIFDHFFDEAIDVFDENINDLDITLPSGGDPKYLKYYNVHIDDYTFDFNRHYDIYDAIHELSSKEIFIMNQNQYKFLINLLDRHSAGFIYCGNVDNIEAKLNYDLLRTKKKENKEKKEMTTREKILDVLEKILKDKKYKDGYPKIVLKCPATEDGEHKLFNALYNTDHIINSYFPKLAEKYEVLGGAAGVIDNPSSWVDFDAVDTFYADIVNDSETYGAYSIGGTYYTRLEEANDPENFNMSSKNSLVIDVDEFNKLCDELYIDSLYHKAIDKLFATDAYEYSFNAEAKIVKSVCKKVNDYINSNEWDNPKHASYIFHKIDEINKISDDTMIYVSIYIEEQVCGKTTILKYYCKYNVDNWKEALNEIFSEEKQKNEEIEKKFVKFSTKKELFNIVGNCALSENDILVIANNNGFLDLVRANVVMENIFNLVHQEIPRVSIPTLNGKLYTDPIDLSKTLGNKGNPYLRYSCSKYNWEKSNDIHVLSYIGSFTNETNKRIFTDDYGKMRTCINASDLFPIYLEIINEKENEKEGNIMKKNNKKAEREIILIDTEFLDNQLEAGNETIEVDEIRKIAEDHMPDGSGVLIKEAYSNKEVEELVKMINNGVDDEPTSPAPTNVMLPEIDRIYYNKTKKTVNIYWENGTETKAITAEGDEFSLTAGIKECFIKYACGNSFDNTQARLLDAKKKAVLTASKEKKNKKTKVERLVDEAASLTADEKNELVKALTEVKDTEVKPVKKSATKRKEGNK